MNFIKQSTATALMVGPFLDSTDGYTLETALTIPSGNIRLSKNGGAFAVTSSAISLTHNESGWYSGTFNTTDTNTAGNLILSVYVSGALPVWKEYTVVPSTIYDWFIGGTAGLSTTTSGFTTGALSQIVASGDAAGWDGSNPITVSGFTTGAITAAAFAAGAINAAAIATDAIGADELAASAVAEIAEACTTSGTAAGWAADTSVGPIVTGIFNEVLVGSLTFRDAQIEQWAYSANDVNLSGTSSGIYHSYYDPTDSGLFVLFATPSGRIRTDL